MSARVGSITTDIIADGLVFNMDAANRASYPRTGTKSFNTIDTTTTGSLDGTTFQSNIPLSFDFDGVDDTIELNSRVAESSIQTNITIIIWFKTTGGGGGGIHGLINEMAVQTPGRSRILVNDAGNIVYYTVAGTQRVVTLSSAIPDNVWNNLTITKDNTVGSKLYINSALVYSNSSDTGVVRGTHTSGFAGTVLGVGAGSTYYMNGEISNIIVYNKALSATEVMENFNALKDRIGYIAPLVVSFLVIAGGGGGGADNGSGWGGGGGAGGYRNSYNNETSGGNSSSETPLELTSTTNYTVTVGGGGSGTSPNGSGEDSVFSTITSIGGGGGGQPSPRDGEDGGSGGGAAHSGNGGSGTSNQGLDGADGVSNVSGGGGGASQAGGNGYNGNGGDGLSSSITGTAITRAGGGGGTNFNGIGSGNAGAGGAGGGGTGGRTANIRDAVANTGGGGGGGIPTGQSGGTGGSGIVILRYPNSYTITVGAGLTSTTSTVGTDKVTVFTAGTDTITFS